MKGPRSGPLFASEGGIFIGHVSFMRENGIAAFAEADRSAGVIRVEKIESLEYWSLFQELVLCSDTDRLYESVGTAFPYRIWAQGNTGCLVSRITENLATALFFDSELRGIAHVEWVQELDKKVRALYETAN